MKTISFPWKNIYDNWNSQSMKGNVAGIMHVIVYVGLYHTISYEIIIDGLFGTHQYLPFGLFL
jgi:hypothetical protein